MKKKKSSKNRRLNIEDKVKYKNNGKHLEEKISKEVKYPDRKVVSKKKREIQKKIKNVIENQNKWNREPGGILHENKER